MPLTVRKDYFIVRLQGQIAKTNDESGDYRSIISGLKKKHALELSEKMKEAEKRLRE